jgi:hypothetical protein
MSLAEGAGRARQWSARWVDRLAPPMAAWAEPEAFVARRAPAFGSGTEAVDRFRAALGSRFFPGAATLVSPILMDDRLPGEAADLVAAADQRCDARFDVLGYRALSFGNPIDWRWDPVNEQRSPIRHWCLIDPLDPEMVGDSKVTWELNRLQWLVTLGQADRMTGDPRYSRVASAAFDAWLDHNPPGLGINWSSSLEVSYRLIAWCWTLALFAGSPFLTPERLQRAVAAIWVHARHVERFLSYYSSPNTHLTGEALGLFYAAVVFPEFRESARWRDLGQRILVDEAARQVTADGVYFEQATCYQRYTIEIYLHFLLLAERNGIALPEVVPETFDRLLGFLTAICGSDGRMPRIGDEDGGWLLPLARRAPDDCRGVAAAAAAWTGRADLKWLAGGLTPEVIWLLGREGVDRFERLPASAGDRTSRAYRDGGYVIMRDERGRDAHELIFDTGPLGCSVTGAHGHADLLSVQCQAWGERYLVDAGTYCYTPEPAWRDFFRGTRAHSTVLVDDEDQAVPAGPFAWESRPTARLRAWTRTADFELADAEHDAYGRLADPVRHRRRVLFLRAGYWVIVDDLVGRAEHQIEVRYQFSPRTLLRGPEPWFLAAGERGGGVWLSAHASAPVDPCIRAGCVDPIDGWVSTQYGQRRPAPNLAFRVSARLPVSIVTLLIPVRAVRDVPRVERRGERLAHQVSLADTGDCVTVDGDDLRVRIGARNALG